jgi:hypothetical protein
MPAVGKCRLVMISDLHKLSPRNKEILKETIEQKPDQLILVLDSHQWNEQESFVMSVKPFVKVFSFQTQSTLGVFDLTDCIRSRNRVEALKILAQLLSNGEHPLQIMGGIVWSWGRSRERLSSLKFSQGLRDLKEADLNIKRSRLNPENALELLVVKLCS